MTLTGKKAELATLLFQLEAVKFGAFKLKAHRLPGNENLPRSPIYLNLRDEAHPVPDKRGPLTQEAMELIGDLFDAIIADSDIEVFTCIADIPEAGAPFGQQAARAARLNGLHTVRVELSKEELSDGNTRITMPDGAEQSSGDICLLVDDLVTGADTKLEAIAALEGAGYAVYDILAVVDRQQGGTRLLNNEGYTVYTIFQLDELLDFYVEQGLVGETKAAEVMRYIEANQVH